jgi:hypothetical protein
MDFSEFETRQQLESLGDTPEEILAAGADTDTLIQAGLLDADDEPPSEPAGNLPDTVSGSHILLDASTLPNCPF